MKSNLVRQKKVIHDFATLWSPEALRVHIRKMNYDA